MKASCAWLNELVPELNAEPEEIARRLTAAGVEVEGISLYGEASRSCVIACVVGIRPHPKKSGLRLVTVDAGKVHGSMELVCGAPNVPDPGGRVVLAPLGANLPAKGIVIAERDIGGVKSTGMLCSEVELGLSNESGGILVLDHGEPGVLLSQAVPGTYDTVLDISLTPNRPDGLGHVGLARELRVLFGLPAARLDAPEIPVEQIEGTRARVGDLVDLEIEASEQALHYGAAILEGVCVGPSPLALRYRLQALGVRSISNFVDFTNYLMLLYGHPMHAFDLDRVRGGKIVARLAKEGEPLTTIDHQLRALSEDDLIIADGVGPVALAGVMGGEGSEISPSTRRVLLEVAYFDPRSIRRASRRHALHTDSSHRFERGVDSADAGDVLGAAIRLARSAGAALVGNACVLHAKRLPVRRAKLRASRLDALLGLRVPFAKANSILQALGCREVASHHAESEWELPSHRPDLAREEDLIEEVMRVHGIDAVPVVLPKLQSFAPRRTREAEARSVRRVAVELGLSEAITYGFTSPKALEQVGAPAAAVVLANPLSVDQSVMRTSLLPGLLEVAARARRHGVANAHLFSIGSVFLEAADPKGAAPAKVPREVPMFVALVSGDRERYLAKPDSVDVWDATGLAAAMAERLIRISPRFVPMGSSGPKYLHPRGAARVEVNGRSLGFAGPLHPDLADAHGLSDTVVLELEVEGLVSGLQEPIRFRPLPRFPSASRDLAIVVRSSIPAGEVEGVIHEVAGPWAEEVRIFDRFSGGNIGEGHVSLAFHVVYRAPDRTLTDEVVDEQHNKVLEQVKARFGAELR